MPESQNSRAWLAANLVALMSRDGLSEAEVARRARVSQRAVNKMVKREVASTIDTIEHVARSFGLSAWQILLPPNELGELMTWFQRASSEGRQHILRVAEREAAYGTAPSGVHERGE